MELWIRSQDKRTLSIVKNITYCQLDGEHALVGYANDACYDFDLGIYKSEERALEVLDEIQNKINEIQESPKTRFICEGARTKLIPVTINFVYQMPEE